MVHMARYTHTTPWMATNKWTNSLHSYAPRLHGKCPTEQKHAQTVHCCVASCGA